MTHEARNQQIVSITNESFDSHVSMEMKGDDVLLWKIEKSVFTRLLSKKNAVINNQSTETAEPRTINSYQRHWRTWRYTVNSIFLEFRTTEIEVTCVRNGRVSFDVENRLCKIKGCYKECWWRKGNPFLFCQKQEGTRCSHLAHQQHRKVYAVLTQACNMLWYPIVLSHISLSQYVTNYT